MIWLKVKKCELSWQYPLDYR